MIFIRRNMPPIGEQFIELASVDSTNRYAAEALTRGELSHGAVIMAQEQTAGRGQRGRTWQGATGLDLMASIVLLPERMRAVAQFTLAKAAALAVRDLVADVFRSEDLDVARIRIKWPNDILVDRHKLAGILIANEIKGEHVRSSIVGIGINVNSSTWEGVDATSLLLETRRGQDLHLLLSRLCMHMDHWWGLTGKDDAAIAAAYTDALWAKDRYTDFTLDGRRITARPLDVDDMGRLIIEEVGGEVAAYGLERLRFLM